MPAVLKKLNPIQWLRALVVYILTKWYKRGGIKSKRNWFCIIVILYWIYILRREMGWLRKKKIEGKHVFLTGASSGLGRLVAIRLAQRGAKLTLIDVNEKGLESTKRMAKAQSAKTKYAAEIEDNIQFIKCDLTQRRQITQAAVFAENKFGPVDILINNAGIVQGKSFLEMSEQEASKTMTVNAESHFWTVKEFLPSMIERNRGHIVCVSSMAGKTGSPQQTDYCASKFAAYGFMEALTYEIAQMKKNIATTTICPSYINTGMFTGVYCPPMVLPMLNQLWVADRMVQAILQEEREVCLPHWIGVINHLSRGLLVNQLN